MYGAKVDEADLNGMHWMTMRARGNKYDMIAGREWKSVRGRRTEVTADRTSYYYN